jgi:hypothetical protein
MLATVLLFTYFVGHSTCTMLLCNSHLGGTAVKKEAATTVRGLFRFMIKMFVCGDFLDVVRQLSQVSKITSVG